MAVKTLPLMISTGSAAPPSALYDRAWVEVDLASLVSNAQAIQAMVPASRLLAVLKADAYGLGASAVAAALGRVAPWGYAVATVEEGARLRESGIDSPILVLMPARREMATTYVAGKLRAVLDDPALAATWPEPYHVEIDTGMNRCGVRWDDPEGVHAMVSPRLEGAFTHFHSADECPGSVERQWERFERALRVLGSRPKLLHAANSAGVWRLGKALDLVRPGVYLYGGRAAPDLPEPLPVVAVRTRVVSMRRILRAETVSYGGDWSAGHDTTIATLGIGYADGVPRAVQGQASVLIGGRRYPVVGRVTMDMTMVEIGPTRDAIIKVGDVATVLGRHGSEEISLEEFAAWSGTCSYEVLTRLSPRLTRHYISG